MVPDLRMAKRLDAESPAAQGIVSPATRDDDPAMRPRVLADFVGQARARTVLEMALSGARQRGEPLDHVLLYGPPGLGKSTLAMILANEMGGGFKAVAAPTIQRQADLASALVSLSPDDVLFVDEIHRLPAAVGEVLYGPMEDFRLDIMTGEPGGGRIVTLPLPRFTLVAATTRPGDLERPLRDRFGIDARLEPYSVPDLARIAARSAGLLGMSLVPGVAEQVAERSRGTPRIANRILRRMRDFAAACGADVVDKAVAAGAFEFLELDPRGLDSRDRAYLDALGTRFRGRPVGLSTIAAALGEDKGTLEDEVEPWLVSQGFVDRTPRGRVLGPSVPGARAATGTLL
jgi:Holliday junction DNA helicase RuvB